ncbi:biotin transporter BioY [Clostridium niameyense]|uniref:biotin transporter BioY n=1 Tax=Clostridium niameyense TaxID=1622073 RepID=UPI00196A16C6|nr:biotin transporter BioY [Clostridium niameyense]
MKVKNVILVSLFAALTAIGAFIKIPIPYVPFTLQFMFCALSAILLGGRMGALSQLVYVITGLIGIPIFTEGGGFSYIFKPTFGFLIGFIVAAYFMGKITERVKKVIVIKIFLIVFLGLIIVDVLGLIHMYLIYNVFSSQVKNIKWIIYYGFILGFPEDLVLTLITSIVAARVYPVLKKIGFNTNKTIAN